MGDEGVVGYVQASNVGEELVEALRPFLGEPDVGVRVVKAGEVVTLDVGPADLLGG